MITASQVSLILPIYNEKGNIGRVVRAARGALGPEAEILVIDDGSADNGAAEVDDPLTTIVTHAVNQGKGAAVRTGIARATRDIIVMMDGDGQDDPKEIHSLLERMDDPAVDYVNGSRFFAGAGATAEQKRALRQHLVETGAVTRVNLLGNLALTKFLQVLFGITITDTQAAFKAFRREKLRRLLLVSNNYEIETEILVKARKCGWKIVEAPVHRYKREAGKSNLFETPLGRVRFGLRFLATVAKGMLLWNKRNCLKP